MLAFSVPRLAFSYEFVHITLEFSFALYLPWLLLLWLLLLYLVGWCWFGLSDIKVWKIILL